MRLVARGSVLLGISLFVLALAAPAFAAIKISKIQYDPAGSDTGTNAHLNQEYVVIKNTGNNAVSLEGWVLRDKANHKYAFGTFKLGAGKSVTIHTGKGQDDRNDLYWGSGAYIWNNDGDKAFLKNASGNTVDTCSYSGGGQSVTC